jgi:hypothetical protein
MIEESTQRRTAAHEVGGEPGKLMRGLAGKRDLSSAHALHGNQR